MNALEALEEAHRIAFAPFVFQASVSLRKLGILDYIFDQREKGGPTAEEMEQNPRARSAKLRIAIKR